MFDCTPVFHANSQSAAKIVINQGGTSSSKTYSIVQLLFYKAIKEAGVVITITGESIPNLKKGAYRDAETIYSNTKELAYYVNSWNKSERIIYFKNGSIIEFVSNLDEQSAKNGKRDYLFVNEANGISYLIFFQLAIRTRKQIFIDYNPTAPFWAHDNLIHSPADNDLSATIQLIISDHRHNCFLSDEQHRQIEGIKDKELWRVYARGKTGNLTGIIYPDWQAIPDEHFPWDDDKYFFGLDFGTNDPNACVKIVRIGDTVFLHELLYSPELSMPEIQRILTANGATGKPVYCDHYPENISHLRRLGITALPARKGQGSVNAGIMFIKKQFKVKYTQSSYNIAEERKRYVWVNDKITGKPSNTPVDAFNHTLDAARMGIYTHYFTGR